MTTLESLQTRSNYSCELCKSADKLLVYEIPPSSTGEVDQCILICETCHQQIDNLDKIKPDHWRCLNDSIWNPEPAVQVMAWRMLNRLSAEGWSQNLLDALYLDDDTLAWAKSLESGNENSSQHKDSNGTALIAGDTITLTKDLNVKGTSFTAKRGTAVRNISLVTDNPEHIEGKINGQQIVILTKFVKKSN